MDVRGSVLDPVEAVRRQGAVFNFAHRSEQGAGSPLGPAPAAEGVDLTA